MVNKDIDHIIEICKQFSINFVLRNGEPLFNAKEGYKLLKILRSKNITVLGLDGFLLSENAFYADLNLIADFSDVNGKPNSSSISVEAAVSFLQENSGDNVFYEFVINE